MPSELYACTRCHRTYYAKFRELPDSCPDCGFSSSQARRGRWYDEVDHAE